MIHAPLQLRGKRTDVNGDHAQLGIFVCFEGRIQEWQEGLNVWCKSGEQAGISKSVGKCRKVVNASFASQTPFSTHILPMHFIDTHETLDLANQTTFFHDNIVVMEVDNLLARWPTYTINFTPERPGPLVSHFYCPNYSIQLTSTHKSLFCG